MPKNIGLDKRTKSLACSEAKLLPNYNFTSWSRPWPPTACTVYSWPSGQSAASENDLKWLPISKNMGLDTRSKSLACSEAELLPSCNFTPWSRPWPPTACTVCSWHSGQSEAFENGLKWLPMPKNMGLDTRTMFLACSEAELEFHFLKYSWSPTAPPPSSWPSGRSGASENGLKWFPISQNIAPNL